jgi:hypothetical protein
MSDGSFFACFGFSLRPWPVPQQVVIVSDSTDDIQFLFIGLPDGSLGLRIIRNGSNEDYETDIIAPDNEFKVVASINYTPSRPSVRINGTEIHVAPIGSRQKGIHQLRTQPVAIPNKPLALTSVIPAGASDAEALFIRSISDLVEASISNDWYVLLKSSAPLRLLLIESLLHKANERHNLKIKFRVASTGHMPPIDVDKLWHNIAPHDLPEQLLVDVNLDQFLQLRVFKSRHGSVTVRDVIRAAANADGGVHLGTPKKSQEELVLTLDKEAMRFGQVASRHILKDICTVVVASAVPLVEYIQRRF